MTIADGHERGATRSQRSISSGRRWNRLGDGEHEGVAFVDGEEFGRATVRVTTLGEEFGRATVRVTTLGEEFGRATVRVTTLGEEFGRATVRVTTLGEEFGRGIVGECVAEDFPSMGERVTLTWQQNQQNFVVTGVE